MDRNSGKNTNLFYTSFLFALDWGQMATFPVEKLETISTVRTAVVHPKQSDANCSVYHQSASQLRNIILNCSNVSILNLKESRPLEPMQFLMYHFADSKE
jgi:hypothetical protein